MDLEKQLAQLAQTLVDKLWSSHLVVHLDSETDLLAIDRIVMHERTGGRMLSGVKTAGNTVARPSAVFGVMDHIIDTLPGRGDDTLFKGGREFIELFRSTAAEAGIPIFDIADERQGIAHVFAPEQGIALPGLTYVCGDSHTCTIGALGALAWGIGVTQGEHALATQTLPMVRPGKSRARFDGTLASDVSAKDMILALIGKYGANGGAGHALEFSGPVIRSMGLDGRFTICNMAVEFGAWTGVIAPDDTVFDYLCGRPYAPSGEEWDSAVRRWRELKTDEEAVFDAELSLDCASLSPQITWGTASDQVIGVDDRVPDPAAMTDPARRRDAERALAYSGLTPGQPISEVAVEAAFIGSCTNARIEDLRAAAAVLKGRKVAAGVQKALCVPGSTQVKRQAEAEGLDRIFIESGFEWRESGCSLCFFAGGETFGDAKRVVTSTNRNFENRQGPGVRSHLASPATVAASAVAGKITRAERLLG